MENNNVTFDTAQALFEQKDYGKCIEVLQALAEGGQVSPETLLLYARLGMRIFSVTDQNEQQKIFSACSDAAQPAVSLEELGRIENILMEEFDQNVLREHYARLSKVPDDLNDESNKGKNWLHYIQIGPDASLAGIYMDASLHKYIKPLLEKEGLSFEEYREKYLAKRPDIKEHRNADVFKLGLAYFDDARGILEEADGANTVYLQAILPNYLRKVVYGSNILNYPIPSEESDDDETSAERMKAYVENMTEALDAVVTMNGQPYSPLNYDRTSDVGRLRKYHERIAKFDPNYTPPALPSAQPIKTQPVTTQSSISRSSSNSSSSGGCYVATAVYGSYDCPEVWTLRRYRDYTLAKTWYGRAFIQTYYAISPTLVKWFGETDWFKNLWKPKLDRMVHELKANGVADTPYQDKTW